MNDVSNLALDFVEGLAVVGWHVQYGALCVSLLLFRTVEDGDATLLWALSESKVETCDLYSNSQSNRYEFCHLQTEQLSFGHGS